MQLSKLLSWLLRHTGPSFGLKLAPDGFVSLADVLLLTHPRFRCSNGRPKYTVEDVALVVRNCNKQRFRLDYKDDSSNANPSSRDRISATDHADDCTTEKSPCLEGCTSNGNDGVRGSATAQRRRQLGGGAMAVAASAGVAAARQHDVSSGLAAAWWQWQLQQ